MHDSDHSIVLYLSLYFYINITHVTVCVIITKSRLTNQCYQGYTDRYVLELITSRLFSASSGT